MQTDASPAPGVTHTTSPSADAWREVRMPTDGGIDLGARIYEPMARDVRAHLLIHGATAVPQGYYARFAEHMARHGYCVTTYDYRGIGASRTAPPDREPATMRDWGQSDASAAFGHVRSIANGAPIIAMGHSFGGQTIGLCDAWQSADAVILVASQLGYWRHWPSPKKWGHALLWYGLVPAATTMFGRWPGWIGLGTDLPKGVARQWARWCRDPEYLLGEEPRARERFERLVAPTLFFSFSDDEYAPPNAVDALCSLLPPRSVHHVRMTPEEAGRPIGHFGYFRPSADALLWQPTLEWLDGVLTTMKK